ncbi:MAG TPA: transposase [Pirellulales bacterium]|nr:transposase [Pirellulales bacterium]
MQAKPSYMDVRQAKGLEIAERLPIRKVDDVWIVPSQSTDRRKYIVRVEDGDTWCSCKSYELVQEKCKHIIAVEALIAQERGEPLPQVEQRPSTKKPTYRQNWPAYNAAQVSEKRKFQELLRDLCRGIAEPPRKKGPGRPTIPLRDAVFAACFKVFSTVSCRRFMVDLEEAKEKGYVERVPCYNSIFNVFESPATTDILTDLILEAAKPLKVIESSFACDSTGFSGSRFDRWFDHKYGRDRIQRAWVKLHAMVGTQTNVITAVEIHDQSAADAPLLPALVATTAKRFDMKEVSADLAYSSVHNLQVVTDAGAYPYIPFKRGTSGAAGGLWLKLFHYFSLNKEEFLPRYHRRSNVETTFSMVKSKFGDSVRSKTDVAMKNEVLAKLVCHNVCCLISAMFELGLDPVFWEAQAG